MYKSLYIKKYIFIKIFLSCFLILSVDSFSQAPDLVILTEKKLQLIIKIILLLQVILTLRLLLAVQNLTAMALQIYLLRNMILQENFFGQDKPEAVVMIMVLV
jgi:hypothetical protein